MSDLLTKYRATLALLQDEKVLETLSETDKRDLMEWAGNLRYNWELHAKPKQKVPPGDWMTWLVLAGRGFGKTRLGAEAIREHVQERGYRSVGLIAATASDARGVMIDGKGGSSLLEVTPQKEGLVYHPTMRGLTWRNGAKGTSFTAEEPERLRGPQHDIIWSDELAAWRYLEQTWDMAMFGLRLGKHPRHIITTTPRPLPMLKDLVTNAVPAEDMREGMRAEVVITRGSTMENADNLAPQALEILIKKYEGTRLGRQELYAELLDDNPNALFHQRFIDSARVDLVQGQLRPGHKVTFDYRMSQGQERAQRFSVVLDEIIIAIDPSMSSNVDSDLTGIVAVAEAAGHIYVLEDASGIYSPNDWARIALRLYQKYNADYIVAEVNQGGDLVEHTIRTAEKEMGSGYVAYKTVRASKGKFSRAEPVGALGEQERIHHVGDFPKLESEMIDFQPGYQKSPDRLDALVWAAHHLVIQHERTPFFIF